MPPLSPTIASLAANLANPSGALVIDTTAPSAPTIVAVGGGDSEVSGGVLDANVTGTAEANSTMALSFNGAPTAGTTVANDLGAWTYTLTPDDLAAIGEGAGKTVTATATDTVGNTSIASGSFSFGVDTIPPTIAISAISTDDILNAVEAGSSLSISGTTNGVQNGRTVAVVLNGDIYTTTVTNNAWTATIGAGNLTAGALPDGIHTVTAYATDLAGNQATPGTRDLTVDQTAPPDAPSTPFLPSASDSGVTGDNSTSVTSPTITGTAENGTTVDLYDGLTLIGTSVADQVTGAWSLTPTLANSVHSLTATSTDAAGNTSTASTAYELTISPDAPAANFTVSGTSNGGATTGYVGGAYTGPVEGLDWEYSNITTKNLNITSWVPNAFLRSGSGMDTIDVSHSNGNNVLDGSTGSNFLVGGTGNDTFFLDALDLTSPAFSSIVNFHAGDNVTVWGINATDFTMLALDGQGAPGYTGLDLIFTAPGHIDTSFVLAGYSSDDLTNGRLSLSFGATADLPGLPGSQYLSVHGN